MPDIIIPTLDHSSLPAYLAVPARGQGPGLLVVHEAFGLSDSIQDLCDRKAAEGFVVLAPDLLSRLDPQAHFSDSDPADWDRASRLYQSFNVGTALCDLLAGLAFLRPLRECTGRVGVLGLGLGGRMAFLIAARSDVDASVCYYPLGLESQMDDVEDIGAPMLMHFGEQDPLIPPPARARLCERLAQNARIETIVHPRAGHGFARTKGFSHHPESARVADDLTLAFLEKWLKK